MARRPIIAGNWKMNLTHLEAIQAVQKLSYALERRDYDAVEVVVCPPFTALRSVQTVLDSDRIPIGLGAQSCHWEDSGAYTGEISPGMLSKLNVTYVICGHSERRHLLGETDEIVQKKLRAVVAHGLVPILCVGETGEERDAGEREAVVHRQVTSGLDGVDAAAIAQLVIAYEPVWAIGTGVNAEPEDSNEAITHIRDEVQHLYGGVAEEVRVQYGGSVNAGNSARFLEQPACDGLLVGGASLDPEQFARIVRWR
jgi:triosephosphate isomerase (TIM)